MSIFKRFSSKKTGDKASEKDQPVLNEAADLTVESSEPSIPAAADDAIPSLKGFTPDEKDIIRSILSDKPTPRSNFNKTNGTEPAKTSENSLEAESIDDYLSDESFKNTLNILKGDLDIKTEFDDDTLSEEHQDEISLNETPIEEPVQDILAEDTVSETDEELTIEDSEIESSEEEKPAKLSDAFPERLTATATFYPASEKTEVEETFKPEVEYEAESSSPSSRVPALISIEQSLFAVIFI